MSGQDPDAATDVHRRTPGQPLHGTGTSIAVLVLSVVLVAVAAVGVGTDPGVAMAAIAVVAGLDVLAALMLVRQYRTTGERLRRQLDRADELERLQTTLLDHMIDGVYMQNRDGKFLAYNHAARTILGLSEAELAGGAALDAFRSRLLHADGSRWSGTDLTPPQATFATGQPQRELVVGVDKGTGEPTWMSFSTAPAIGPDGRVEAVVTCLSDVTDRHSARLAATSVAAQRRQRVLDVLDRQRISMVFQPIMALDNGRIVGAEALARFPGHPNPTPDVWFADAAAEDLGLDLELAAISAALGRLHDLPAGAYLSVNVSPAAVLSPQLQRLLGGVPAHRIVVELTEHESVDNYEEVVGALRVLRASGVRLAVDDAGAGFASLRHILNLRPDLIKLDLGITRGIDDDPARRALAASLLAFGAEIGAGIVAEGIETANELDALKALGVRFGQGYHLGMPAPLPLTVTEAALAS
ncbi:MAG TPA: EAL domain-containing protein [Mycobacteriales bacterium]|nr:EAL domain-containing protein [Mycobacteriales bacterium]